MNPSPDALAALRDIHLPEAVSFWPLAPGWWVLLALCLLSATAVLLALRARRRSLKRAALRLLDSAERDFASRGDATALAGALSGLLRRVALARFPRRDVAALHGDAWLGFLARDAARSGFPADVVTSLERALYGGAEQADASGAEGWLSAARAWIRRTA